VVSLTLLRPYSWILYINSRSCLCISTPFLCFRKQGYSSAKGTRTNLQQSIRAVIGPIMLLLNWLSYCCLSADVFFLTRHSQRTKLGSAANCKQRYYSTCHRHFPIQTKFTSWKWNKSRLSLLHDGVFFNPEERCDMFLQNIGWLSEYCMALYPTRYSSP
jgi:hypothetical protein